MIERWREVADATDYEVSDMGRVRRSKPDKYGRCSGRAFQEHRNGRGYLSVTLTTPSGTVSRSVHSLVCGAFHGPKPTDLHEVAHGDGNRLNNHAGNLRWATRKENFQDRDRHGRTARGDRHPSRTRPECLPRGEQHGNAKITEEVVRDIRASREILRVLAERHKLSITHVSDIRRGKSWRHIASGSALAAVA
jgi:hypothetical protein